MLPVLSNLKGREVISVLAVDCKDEDTMDFLGEPANANV